MSFFQSIQTRSSINEEPSRTGSPLTPTTTAATASPAVTAVAAMSRERHSSVKCVDSKSGEEYEIVIASASNSSSSSNNNNDDDIEQLPDDLDDVRSIP